MSNLYIAVTDVDGLALSAGAPLWPMASRLLARADRRAVAVDWREWVLGQAGLSLQGDGLPMAAQLARAAGYGTPAAEGWWLASPLRLVPGMSHVQLDPRGVLTLSATMRQQLVADFTANWPDPSVQLYDTPFGLMLSVAVPLRAHSVDPAGYAGRHLDDLVLRGPEAGALMRLMTELQMWLHGRGVHSEQGVDVNAFWLWGGGSGHLEGVGHWPILASQDPWLRLLSDQQGPTMRTDRLETWSTQLALAAGDSWQSLDARWWRTLSQALTRGQWQRAYFYLDGVEYHLTRWHCLRFWRRTHALGERSR